MRAAALVGLTLFLFGCATPPQPEVASFRSLPGFEPVEEFVPQANRKLAIMSEGVGEMTSGERFYYIAYATHEEVADLRPGAVVDPLWGEMQALWKQRRSTLDAAEYAFVILDARAFPGTPGSRTRRIQYESEKGRWKEHPASGVVLEEQDLP